ncbi:ATP-binding protein [Rhizobium leguminosarum]|uniref:Transcriptional regulator n=1 Tax=Rhizobium leguminosarum bv. viciae TaxID=387 RepID=A0A8G2MQA7_RHILV|nr:winged helix-turn-helix domain-containing protein [Rhizobium leguminosarum]NKK21158.1 AAA family ATPase [Rhizobium leguminosarum bv. viciae]TBX94346.1 transcriptional regulator [Rhizobium leguminosarum bv. viciae]TBZ20052.1 transcriptional regulator [Rhizobium leguminosarum bv. viciae]
MEELEEANVTTYCFGDCRFIPARQLLLHREVPIRVGSRAIDLLHALVRRPGIVVSKDELFRAAWPNVFVDESNLKVNIAVLRRALAQVEPDLTCIATVPGRGYRFVAPLRVLGVADEAALSDAVRGISGELPAPPALIGRDEAMADLAGALAETRLLTIVGPPGVGKTSVAVATARQVGESLKDGVCFVDLAAIDSPQLVAPAIAFACGLNSNLVNILAGLVEMLRDRELLLVLDNCEHVLNAAATVADHLNHALPRLLVVTTSREPLRCRRESVYRLAPLRFPPAGSELDAAAALDFSAVELLVQRAVTQGYRLDDADASSLAAISRRLDGIALAIELAAPRLSTDGPAKLADLLENAFDAFVLQGNAAAPRHMTLMAMLDWSYRLLPEREACLLRHLSLFSGTFTLNDVVGVCGHLGSAEDVGAWLESLAARSLSSVSYHSGHRYYRLLDSTRSFASERLRASGEEQAAMASYTHYLLALFEQGEVEWNWRAREDWTARYGRWGNDLHRAIDWAWRDGHNRELGIRLTAAAIPLWNELSSLSETRTRVAEVVEGLNGLAMDDVVLRLKLVSAHALNLNFGDDRGPEIEAAWREARTLADETGNVEYRLRTTMGWAGAKTFAGNHRQVLSALSELRGLLNQEGGHSAVPDVTRLELVNRFYCGDIETSVAGLKALARSHSTVAYRSQTSRFQLDRFVGIRSYLAPMLWVVGEHREAFDVAQECILAATTIGHPVSLMHALAVGGLSVSLWSGLLDVAQDQLKRLEAQYQICQLDIWPPLIRFYRAAIDTAGRDAQAVDRTRDAIGGLRSRNLRIHFAMNLAMLADAALSHNRLDVARAVAAEASDYLERDEAWCRSELFRVIGLTRWREGDVLSAAENLAMAVRAAQRSGALTLELRAATQQAKLALQTGHGDIALSHLACVYQRFESGLHTADVVAARDQLEVGQMISRGGS